MTPAVAIGVTGTVIHQVMLGVPGNVMTPAVARDTLIIKRIIVYVKGM